MDLRPRRLASRHADDRRPRPGDLRGLRPIEARLKPVRSATWFDAVFVNLSGDAAPFESFIAPVAERWKDFGSGGVALRGPRFLLRPGCRLQLEARGGELLRGLPPAVDPPQPQQLLAARGSLPDRGGRRRIRRPGSTAYRPQLVDNEAAFPTMPGLPARWHGTAEYVALFPNALFGVHADHFFAGTLMPKGPRADHRAYRHLLLRRRGPGRLLRRVTAGQHAPVARHLRGRPLRRRGNAARPRIAGLPRRHAVAGAGRHHPLLLPLGGEASGGGEPGHPRRLSGDATLQISQASPLQPCLSRPNIVRTGGR